LQTINAYETVIENSNLLSASEKDHFLLNLAIVKSFLIVNSYDEDGKPGGDDWGCAGDVLVPTLAGAVVGDGIGGVLGMADGLWNAYRNGCMD